MKGGEKWERGEKGEKREKMRNRKKKKEKDKKECIAEMVSECEGSNHLSGLVGFLKIAWWKQVISRYILPEISKIFTQPFFCMVLPFSRSG